MLRPDRRGPGGPGARSISCSRTASARTIPTRILVRQAALATGLPPSAAEALETRWDALPVWSGAQGALDRLVGRTRLGVVTNCSVRLGRAAAARLQVPWDVVITAAEAGFYKPDPRPYRLALERLRVGPGEAAFRAGSGCRP